MTVSELIKKLQDLPQDLPVLVQALDAWGQGDGYGEPEDPEILVSVEESYVTTHAKAVVIV